MKRTYSRKRRHRRNWTAGTVSDEAGSSNDAPAIPRKRQKIEVEVVLPISPGPSRIESHDHAIMRGREDSSSTEIPVHSAISSSALTSGTRTRTRTPRDNTFEKGGTTSARCTPDRSHVLLNARLTPPRNSLVRSETIPVLSDTPHSASPRKIARDLSALFDFSLDINTPKLNAPKSKPRASIAKHMLRRSHTESSIDGTIRSRAADGIDITSTPTTPRKLGKLRSESNIDLTFGSPSSRGHSSSPSKSQAVDVSSPAVSTTRPAPTTTNIRTYAGSSRSFLVALPTSQPGSLSRTNSASQSLLDADEDILATRQEDDFEMRASYTELRERWGVDGSEDDPRPPSPDLLSPASKGKRKGKAKQVEVELPPLPNGMMNDLKSITELRNKGESRRFLDEVGYLFEGLDAKGAIGVRRGSALEVVTKLCDAEFARKAAAADFLGRTWEVLRGAGAGDGDKILDTILTLFAALVAKDPRDLSDLVAKSDFASVLHDMLASLERSNDPLWLISSSVTDAELRIAGISKVEKTLLATLHKLIRKKSGLLEEHHIVSNRLLLTQALAVLPPSLHCTADLPSLLRSLSLEIGPLSSRVSAYISGLSLFPSHTSSSHLYIPSLLHADNCLRMLDSFLLGSWSNAADDPVDLRGLHHQCEDGLAQSLIAFCVASDVISRDPDYRDQRVLAYRSIESVLRVLINLTHDDLPWSRAILREKVAVLTVIRLIVMAQRQHLEVVEHEIDEDIQPGSHGDGSASSLDRLCLALGLLTNLVQVCDDAKDLIRETLIDYSCTGKRVCVDGCRCSSCVSALECLALVYTRHCKSHDEFDPVVRGHMAVLFGLLMRQSSRNQRMLLDVLPGPSDRMKLNSLVENAREFTSFYVALTRGISAATSERLHTEDEADIENDAASGDGGAGPRAIRDEKGAAVARDVISFLERLRDGSVR